MGERLTEGHGQSRGNVGGQHSHENPEQNSGVSRLSQLKRDVLLYGTISAAIPLFLLTALSDKQRRSVRDDRDGGKCQFPGQHHCTPDRLEVHHISPQRWEESMDIPEEVRDRKNNVLTICYTAHQVVVHPDMEEARAKYRRGDKGAFRDVFVARLRKIARREPYWETVYDAAMMQRARQLTAQAEARGWQMPTVKRRTPNPPPVQGTLAA